MSQLFVVPLGDGRLLSTPWDKVVTHPSAATPTPAGALLVCLHPRPTYLPFRLRRLPVLRSALSIFFLFIFYSFSFSSSFCWCSSASLSYFILSSFVSHSCSCSSSSSCFTFFASFSFFCWCFPCGCLSNFIHPSIFLSY